MQQDKEDGVKDVDETAIIFCFCFLKQLRKKMEILNKFVALVWE